MNSPHDDKKTAPHAAAGHTQETCAHSHEGKIVSMIGDKLTTTCSEGKQHNYTVAKDAKVTCDGKASKATDLKAGNKIRVTTKKDDKNVATGVECLDKHAQFAQSS